MRELSSGAGAGRRTAVVGTLLVLVAAGAFAVSAMSSEPGEQASTPTSEPPVVPSSTPTVPELIEVVPDDWEVEIAVAVVPEVRAFREIPEAVAGSLPDDPATLDGPPTEPNVGEEGSVTDTTSLRIQAGADVTIVLSPEDVARMAANSLMTADEDAYSAISPEAEEVMSPLVYDEASGGVVPAEVAGVTVDSLPGLDGDVGEEGDADRAPAESQATADLLEFMGVSLEPREAPAPSVSPPAADLLSPIPSPGLSWGAEATEYGWSFENPTPSGNPRVFLVDDREGDWVHLVLPTRPNNELGWVEADDLVFASHRWHIEIDVSARVLRLWEGDRLEVETAVVVGRDSTQTPLGRFFLNERVPQAPGTFYSPWVLSTNAFSDLLERFQGEVPIIALHGGGYPSTVGTAASNGCIRIPEDALEKIGALVPMGTPVDIFA